MTEETTTAKWVFRCRTCKLKTDGEYFSSKAEAADRAIAHYEELPHHIVAIIKVREEEES